MARPTDAEIDALRNRLKDAIEAGHREIFVAAFGDELAPRTLLVELCRHDKMMANDLLDELRAHARSFKWPQRDVVRISFARFLERARALDAAQADEVKLAERTLKESGSKNTRDKRQTNQTGPVPELNAQAMVAQDGNAKLIILGQLMIRRPERVWFDEFHHRMMTDWRGTYSDAKLNAPVWLDDAIENSIETWLGMIDERLGRVPYAVTRRAIADFAWRLRRNEAKEWLESLEPWDPRDPDLLGIEGLKIMGIEPTPFTIATFRNFWVSMVARMMVPGAKVDTMPCLYGGQGLLKSTSLQVIGGDRYREAKSKIGSKDFLMSLWGVSVLELPDKYVAKGVDVDTIKAQLSSTFDVFRVPYGYRDGIYRRTAVWASTTNRPLYLEDPTGARRDWPWPITGRIDVDQLKDKRTAMFRQAVYYLRLGVSDPLGRWWEVPEDDHRAATQAVYVPGAHDSRIEEWLDTTLDIYTGEDNSVPPVAANLFSDNGKRHVDPQWGTLVTTDRVAAVALGMNAEELARGKNVEQITNCLEHLGWMPDRRKISGTNKPVRFWTRRKRGDDEITRAAAPNDQGDNSTQSGTGTAPPARDDTPPSDLFPPSGRRPPSF